MAEYIKREDAINALGEEPYVWSDTDVEIAEHAQWVSDVKAIEAVLSADVVELELSPVCYKCDGKTADGVRTEKCLWLNGDNSKCIEQAHKLLYLAERGERYEQIHYGIEPSTYVLQKHGKWINPRPDSEMCSACGVRFSISSLFAVGGNEEPNFCPNCGADMRDEQKKGIF